MREPMDAYKILQVDPGAEDDVIRAAHRRLARKYHPDLAEGPEAATRMASINAAWTLVGTPAARQAYDRTRADAAISPRSRGAAQPGGSSAQAPGSGRRGDEAAGRGGATGPAPEAVSRNWTSGRSTMGGGFDASMRTAEGLGAAGPPPGRPSGAVLTFGRYSGWSLGEIARQDLEYLEWLDRMPIGRAYREEIDVILRARGRRQSADADATDRRGLFRRR